MTTVILNIPKGFDVDALVNAFSSIGLKPAVQEEDEELISLEDAVKEAYPNMTEAEINGELLKTARKNANLTQTQLAEISGVHKENISAFERGKRPITKKTAQKFAKALKIPYHTFL